MALLKKLLNNLAFHSPAILTEEEGNKHPKELEVLISLGVLKQDSFPQERWCPSCESESVSIQTISKERAYTLCTTNEEAARDYFNPQTLKQWRFDTPHFISLFLKTLGINQSTPTENIAGLLWDLGSHDINGGQYHLFFTRGIDNIETDKRSIITSLPHSAVFYLGAVHTALPDDVLLIPVLDMIKEVKRDGITLAPKALNTYFVEEIYSDEGDDIELDKNIILSQKRNRLLLHKKRGGNFEKEVRVSPQAARLIAYCYQIRHNDENSRTLQELADALAGGSKVSISNRIKEVTDASNDNGVTILHKFSGEKWGLNQRLGCCK